MRFASLTVVLCCGLAPVARAADAAPARTSAPIPDFSGIWAHLSWPDVEPPLQGAGPVRNRSRRPQPNNVSGPVNNPVAAKTSTPNGVSNTYELVGDYANPILKPGAAEVVKQHGEMSLRSEVYPTPANQCWPSGVPFAFFNIGMQMLQQKDEVIILYADNNEVRHVRINQRHPAHVTPSWFGDSVGHYEGDALVIDTIGIKVGRFAMVDMYGTPHTEALHVVERYRLLNYEAANEAEERGERENFRLPVADEGFARDPDYKGPGLQLEFTVDDAGVFTMPWSALVTYRRPLGTWPEYICADSTHDDIGRPISLPQAGKPDF
jgi:hypothetical protein